MSSSRKTEIWGIALALIGALLFSTKAVLVKLAYQYDVDAVTLLFLRMAFALPFYLVALLRIDRASWNRLRAIKIKYWLGTIAAGSLGYYLSSLLDFVGLQYIDASIERLILFIYPTIIAILAYFFFKERLTWRQSAALVTTYLGLVFVFGNQLGHISLSNDFWKGSLLIFACAITFATFLVMSQWLIKRFGVIAFTSFSMIVACMVVCLHFVVTTEILETIQGLDRSVLIYALLMAVIATVLPSYIVNMAIQRIGAIRMAIVSSIGPFSTISLAYVFLGERLEPMQLFGALFIVLGVTIVSVERRRKQ